MKRGVIQNSEKRYQEEKTTKKQKTKIGGQTWKQWHKIEKEYVGQERELENYTSTQKHAAHKQ